MGNISSGALASMFALFLITMFAGAMYTASDDATKKDFVGYGEYRNLSELNEGDIPGTNSQNTVTNMQRQSEAIANKIGEAQTQLNSNDITEQLLGAFGIISALTIDVLALLLAVMLDGVNFISGIASNLGNLESPWDKFAVLGGFGVALFMAWFGFKLVSAILKWDV